MLRCGANMWASVCWGTQGNHDKDTPGVDEVLITAPEERARLCTPLSPLDRHQVHPVRRVYIPKRALGIPTIIDRGVQPMVKSTLEPFWEARFEGSSYGVRPGW
jgi:RNA-directed DNA polymerase